MKEENEKYLEILSSLNKEQLSRLDIVYGSTTGNPKDNKYHITGDLWENLFQWVIEFNKRVEGYGWDTSIVHQIGSYFIIVDNENPSFACKLCGSNDIFDDGAGEVPCGDGFVVEVALCCNNDECPSCDGGHKDGDIEPVFPEFPYINASEIKLALCRTIAEAHKLEQGVTINEK